GEQKRKESDCFHRILSIDGSNGFTRREFSPVRIGLKRGRSQRVTKKIGMIVSSEAIVLRARKQGETSKIVTLYTLAYGKLNVIAKGAREMKSKFGGALEAFSHINAIFYKKENVEPGLYLLSKAETIESNAGILNSLSKIEAATGIVELMLRSM